MKQFVPKGEVFTHITYQQVLSALFRRLEYKLKCNVGIIKWERSWITCTEEEDNINILLIISFTRQK